MSVCYRPTPPPVAFVMVGTTAEVVVMAGTPRIILGGETSRLTVFESLNVSSPVLKKMCLKSRW